MRVSCVCVRIVMLSRHCCVQLGTHVRAKRKVNEMANQISVQQEAAKKDATQAAAAAKAKGKKGKK